MNREGDFGETGIMSDNLLTIRDFIRWGMSRFNEARLSFGHGTDNALDESLTLVLHALHLPHDIPESLFDCRLTLGEQEKVYEILYRRINERRPAAYLTGRAWFAGLEFIVNSKVLVPRSPIAELIEQALSPWIEPDRVERVLDLCTGSGCIGIACAHTFPDARVDLSDLSEAALAVARENVALHHLEQQVEVIHSDLFDALAGRSYDAILSNPPYVASKEYQALPREFAWEPRMGLEAGADGLDLVRRILAQAAGHLNPGGILVVEVGSSAEHLIQAYPGVPFTWLEFERGGDGVFLLTREQLVECSPALGSVNEAIPAGRD